MAIGTVPPLVAEVPLASGHPGRSPAHRPGEGASGGETAPLPAPTIAEAAQTLPTATPLDRVVAAALARQDGLSHLFAAAAALLARGKGDLPFALEEALRGIAGLPLKGPPDAATLKTLILRSGLFHEALAMGGDGRASGDLKSIIAELRSALAAFLVANPSAQVAEPARDRRPPPRPGQPMAAEPPAPPPDEVDLPLLARRVVGEADRALARVALHQAVVLEEAGPRPDAQRPSAFAVELPIAGAAGVGVASLRVERDGGQDAGVEPAMSAPIWRVELALSVEPLGAMEARIGLMPGRRMVAGLWCEDPAAILPLKAEIDRLRTELESAGLELGAIDLHIGRPPPRPRTAAPPVHRIDLAL